MLIISAGNQPWSQSPWDEADIVRDLLMEWGVPEEAILLEGSGDVFQQRQGFFQGQTATIFE